MDAIEAHHIPGVLSSRCWRDGVMSENSVVVLGCLRGTVVVVQHATDSLAPANRPFVIGSVKRLNQLVTDALVVPLALVSDLLKEKLGRNRYRHDVLEVLPNSLAS